MAARNFASEEIDIDAASAWPAHRSVALLPGSLPKGGVVPDTPIHAFVTPPPQLSLEADAGTRPTRHDIELGGLLAFEIRNLATDSEADALIEASERFGYRDEAPGIATPPGMRMNKSVHWMADLESLGPLFARMRTLLPPDIDGMTLYPRLSERLNMYRYDDGDVFNLHTDGEWPGFSLDAERRRMLQWPAHLRSGLTMLLYLNGPDDGVQGGDTRLYRPDRSHHDVRPAKGSALFFRHGFGPGSVLHVGRPVHGPVAKYVARINVMYEAAPSHPGARRAPGSGVD
ncbi:2OG-Fe(II) oxygenase [Variovorax sp. RHLX14]|uniref:2OG-Fe(II) oxygenase n=1 Tax=Variovorax sp. RHLX14 TaxID=1259731 RepID=UPI003F47AE86